MQVIFSPYSDVNNNLLQVKASRNLPCFNPVKFNRVLTTKMMFVRVLSQALAGIIVGITASGAPVHLRVSVDARNRRSSASTLLGKSRCPGLTVTQNNGQLICGGIATKKVKVHHQMHLKFIILACPPSWDVGSFGECSHSCGGGIRKCIYLL